MQQIQQLMLKSPFDCLMNLKVRASLAGKIGATAVRSGGSSRHCSQIALPLGGLKPPAGFRPAEEGTGRTLTAPCTNKPYIATGQIPTCLALFKTLSEASRREHGI
jgi:hypothetical protein